MHWFDAWFYEGRPIRRLNISGIPPLFAALVGGLLGLLFTVLALRLYQDRQEQQLLGDYGQALANLAARRAVDATLNHDLVSLQVILQDVTQNPRVLLASIHDVENNLLVQAGDTRSLADASQVRSFSAAIPLQDSVAGYVSVYLTRPMPQARALGYSFAGVATLLMMFALLSLRAWRGHVWWPPRKPRLPKADAASPDNTQTLAAATEASTAEVLPEAPEAQAPEPQGACLLWRWENLALLRQQVSAERLAKCQGQVLRSVRLAAGLGGASLDGDWREASQSGEFRLWFPGESYALAVCAALRCAQQLQALNPFDKVSIRCSASVASAWQATAQAYPPGDHTAIYVQLEGAEPADWDDWIYYNEREGALQWLGFVPPLDDQADEALAQLQAQLQLPSNP